MCRSINYRWIRGFNDYDNWQASGVSGQGAGRFTIRRRPPPAPTAICRWSPRKDPGNRDGKIHSHRFAAANTAVAYVNQDQTQMEATENS